MNQMAALREVDAGDLLPGTRLLNGQYQILEPLQKGGFAMTYVARDSLDRNVVIKECFPAGLCNRRNGQVRAVSARFEAQFAALKQQFICEARGMAKLHHPYVVAVHQVFEENNTAYMALDYVDGIDLISVQEDEPQRLNSAFLDSTLRETLKAVRHIHSKGVLHRDIAPDNLRVSMADRITLIDFGAAEAQSQGSAFATGALQAVKDGYSPPEFYLPGGVHDFSSDLYSLGATFYFLITGEVPPSGRLRRETVLAGGADPYVPLASGNWECSYPLVLTIDMALELDRTRRPQTADQWLKMLDEAPQKRPAQKAAALSDHELNAVLAKLVKDVNRNLKAEAPASAAAPASASAKVRMPWKTSVKPVAESSRKEKWFDIFGNPISDVASWMIEQEAKPVAPPECDVPAEEPVDAAPKALVEAPRIISLPEPAQPDLPLRKSGFLGLFSRRVPRRQNAVPT
jgi:hypothetical protein